MSDEAWIEHVAEIYSQIFDLLKAKPWLEHHYRADLFQIYLAYRIRRSAFRTRTPTLQIDGDALRTYLADAGWLDAASDEYGTRCSNVELVTTLWDAWAFALDAFPPTKKSMQLMSDAISRR